jgi:Putative adhesin
MPEHHFHTPEPVELDVKVPAADIVIETVDGDESFVVVEGTEKLVEHTFVELRGNRLVVEFRGPKPFGFTLEIGGWRIGNEKLNIHARVPHSSRPVINTVSGDTNIAGRIGSIDAKTMSGDLAVFADVERDATVKTVSGDARFQASIGGDLQAQTVSGDVYAARVGGSVTTKSVSGDVRIESVREGKATLQSVSGDIVLAVERGTSLDVDANSVSGDLDSEVALGGELDGLEGGDGPTLVVRGKTVSGDFRITRA